MAKVGIEMGTNAQEPAKEIPPKEYDPWADTDLAPDPNQKSWAELSAGGRVARVLSIVVRIFIALSLLYLFICSLDFLGSAFSLIGGRAAGGAFSDSNLLNNPICGLMLGILITVVLQSSSSTTSITVTMVAANLITVRQGIFIAMGSTIGTSVTSTLVSLTQSGDRNEFRRAFGCAAVNQMSNWIRVIVFLPIEAGLRPLERMTTAMTRNLQPNPGQKPPEMLKAITKPFTNLWIQLDQRVVEAVALKADLQKRSFLKYYCPEKELGPVNATFSNLTYANKVFTKLQNEYWTYEVKRQVFIDNGVNKSLVSFKNVSEAQSSKCRFLFHGQGMPGAPLSDVVVGVIMLIIALTMLLTAVLVMVKVLQSLLRGPLFSAIKKVINAEFPGHAACLTGYVAMLVGAGLTMVLQSSSILTATLTPLVGIGLVTIERVFPIMLGSTVGTTFTGILAALVQTRNKFRQAMQLALCHFFFAIFGVILLYPVPHIRKFPIFLGRKLGDIIATYRWFAVVFVLASYFFIPLTVFALSIPGWQVLAGVGIPVVVFILIIIIINLLQTKKKEVLPKKLQTWDFLPKPLHSLQPYDVVFSKMNKGAQKRCPCCPCCKSEPVAVDVIEVPEKDNPAFEKSNGHISTAL